MRIDKSKVKAGVMMRGGNVAVSHDDSDVKKSLHGQAFRMRMELAAEREALERRALRGETAIKFKPIPFKSSF